MNAPEFWVEKRLPSSMPSLIATFGGISSMWISSKAAMRSTLRSMTAMRSICQFCATDWISSSSSGVASWVPVYPIDVVKTNLQSTTCAGRGESFGACATRLYRAGGVGIFWEGIGPKVLRAIVNHATTFYVFDLVCARALVG